MKSTPSSRNFTTEFSEAPPQNTSVYNDCIYFADFYFGACDSIAAFFVNAALNFLLSVVTIIALKHLVGFGRNTYKYISALAIHAFTLWSGADRSCSWFNWATVVCISYSSVFCLIKYHQFAAVLPVIVNFSTKANFKD